MVAVHNTYQPLEQGRHVVSVSFYNERWTDHTLAFHSDQFGQL